MEIEIYKTQRTFYSNEIRKDNIAERVHPFYKKSNKDIRTSNPSIKTFIQTLKADTEQMFKNPPKYHQNLTKGEKMALKDLSGDPNIVIHSADKGGATVIQSYRNYHQEILRQLDDTATYMKLTYDPVSKFQTRIKNHIELGIRNGYLDEKTAQFLYVANPKHPVLYTLPKIHKDPITPPGRPIVSVKEGLLEPVTKYIDHYIKKSVMALPTCLRDTQDFIHKINLTPDIEDS
ncbi:Hypothetical predicted protein, partial [Pelobates cultripes]